MTQYVAFLRGMNLGNRRIKMTELAAHFTKMKFRNVATFIASGNVLFDAPESATDELETKIERSLAKALGYEVDTFVRTRAEVAALTVATPFSKADLTAPENTLLVGFFKSALAPDIQKRLVAIRTEVDEFSVEGREYFWLCRIKMNESKVWQSPTMRALKLPTSSMRNITSLKKLSAQFPPAA
jgi:uncharacterized protein (DUF1697 family)